ncbi:bifunctional phosphopantothenoylcysteine decarboxylase/phosphopantothenate--cysteine ligase CoaBC [Lactobacillus corticis]|uniref:Coenzyme A biosynthesis bifunctional protein CoaBC n=1 Tax=Lactobacillus corticis TaxID=2201249 RepID=A0A916VHS1_9LACO|nr:bifunctional phosphopantothenoylcysteine decarboxylase/phosphopantothenate--cysteine ligase CoaBC [Lactobacillus corticis]GFZ26957.1 phosphopantothenoylcysteine decarboxylase / phosphopantothenate-cysteine ligase [Lactobacillus corticis]
MTRIAVYFTGGIACYKAVEVVRGLEKAGHEVRCVMTENAQHFIGSQTLAALTKYPVLTNLWAKDNEARIAHVELARWSQLALVVPATANFIAKMALGLADDAASTTILASSCPKLVVPAMNDQMWANSANKRNLLFLRENGVKILEPATGFLAEGYAAKGRMPEPAVILDWVEQHLRSQQSLRGEKIVVTAGGTLEPIDPVRFIGNRSSGKMGIAIAQAAAEAGADVTLIYGHVTCDLPDNRKIKLIHASQAEQMASSVKEAFRKSNCLIMAAAVADWQSAKVADHKLKKQLGQTELNLKLVRTPDILATTAADKRSDQLVIGFAAETNDLLKNAQVKLQKKGADYIIANDVSKDVFGSDQDQVTVISRQGQDRWPRLSKSEIAQKIIALVARELEKRHD